MTHCQRNSLNYCHAFLNLKLEGKRFYQFYGELSETLAKCPAGIQRKQNKIVQDSKNRIEEY